MGHRGKLDLFLISSSRVLPGIGSVVHFAPVFQLISLSPYNTRSNFDQLSPLRQGPSCLWRQYRATRIGKAYVSWKRARDTPFLSQPRYMPSRALLIERLRSCVLPDATSISGELCDTAIVGKFWSAWNRNNAAAAASHQFIDARLTHPHCSL